MAERVSKKSLIQQELEQIVAAAPDGLLHAEAVLDFAEKNPNSALHLHGGFIWDNDEAARRQRLDHARALIRVHVTIIERTSESTRAWVSLTSDRTKGGGYRPVISVLGDHNLRQQMLADAYRVMKTFMQKYGTLQELGKVIDAMQQTIGGKAESA